MSTKLLKRKIRRVRKRTVGIVLGAVVVAAGIGTWLYLDRAVVWRLRAAESEADRLDPGWRLADLLANREDIPDEENSALRVIAVERSLPPGWPPSPRVSRTLGPDGKPISSVNLLVETDEVPDNERLGLDLTAEIRFELQSRSESVVRGRALAGMDRGRYPLAIAPDVISTLLSDQQRSRNVTRLLRADAYLRAQDGNLDGALESCRAMLMSGRALGDEPFAISQLIRMSTVNMTIDAARRVLAQGEPSEAALAAFQSAMEEEARHPYLRIAIRSERAAMDVLFAKLVGGEVSPAALGGGPGLGGMAYLPMKAAFVRYNHALYLEEMNEAVEISKRLDPELNDAWSEWETRREPDQNVIAQAIKTLRTLLSTGLSAITNAHLRVRGRQAAAIVAIAAERQRQASGRLPGSLASIDPKFLPVPPLDPFDGRPVRVRETADGLVIYTLGPDLQDNSGTFDPNQKPIDGTDQGLVLFRPERRGLPSPRELPSDVFQHEPEVPRAEDEPL